MLNKQFIYNVSITVPVKVQTNLYCAILSCPKFNQSIPQIVIELIDDNRQLNIEVK